MKSSGMILVLATVLCVPATGRASSREGGDTQVDPTPEAHATQSAAADGPALDVASAAVAALQTGEVAVETPPERRTGFRTLFRDLGGDFAHVPSRDSLFVAAIGGGAALALHPIDTTFNAHLETSSIFGPSDRLGDTATLMGAAFAVYGVGRVSRHNRVTHVAMDVVRAQVVSEVMAQTLKIAVRRERPDASSGYSFPSGHAAVTFATATVLQRHHGFKWALPAYGLASYVAASRLHDNVHFVSDVVFGAAVGTLAGRTTSSPLPW